MPQPWVHPREGVPRDRRGEASRRPRRRLRHRGRRDVRASTSPGTQERKQGSSTGSSAGIAAMCKGRKVEVFNGVGSLGAGPHRCSVSMADGSAATITGDNVLLAAGSVPRLIPGFERGGPIMTSDEVLDLDRLPARVVVIGGGAIGCEFASTFADLGSEVTILEGLPKILPGLDADLAKVVEKSFKKKKIAIRTGVMVNGHTPNGHRWHHRVVRRRRVRRGRRGRRVGRAPTVRRSARSRRAPAVVVDERGFVEVDEYCRTGEPGVYAVGDLIDTPQLAHVGVRRGDPGDQAPARRVADAGRLRPGAVGDLLPPRGGLGRPRRGAGARRRATTSSSPSTRSSSTAGRRSSVRPKVS